LALVRKPTWTTGHIAFGRDGSVTKHTQRLPDCKAGQEVEVAARFLELLEPLIGRRFRPRPLAENDNDFDLEPLDAGPGVKLELTELAFAHWGRALTLEEWLEGRTGFKEFVMPAPDTYYGIDTEARDAALARLLRKKVDKHYDKPADRAFWLLIWTVAPAPGHVYSQDGVLHCSVAFANLLRELAEHGSGPFDAIWFAEHPDFLHPVWPKPPAFESNVAVRGDAEA